MYMNVFKMQGRGRGERKAVHVKQLPPELSRHMYGNVSGDSSHPRHVLRGYRVGEVCLCVCVDGI